MDRCRVSIGSPLLKMLSDDVIVSSASAVDDSSAAGGGNDALNNDGEDWLAGDSIEGGRISLR